MIHFNTGSPHIPLGGHYFLLTKFLNGFFDRLKRLNAELVFFMHVHKYTDDVKLFIPNAEEDYIECLSIMENAVNKNRSKGKRPGEENVRIPFTFEYNSFRLAKQFGTVNINYFRHNQEIAKYLKLHENEILSIISNDTDFAIFDGDYQFWYVNEMNMKEMMVGRINNLQVHQTLNLNRDQLHLLSAISFGNIFPYGVLKNFYTNTHDRVTTKSRFLRLIDYVKNQQIDPQQIDLQRKFNLKKICEDIFGENYTEFDMNAVENGIKQYSIDFDVSPRSQLPVIKLMKEKNPFMYQLYNDYIFLVKDIHYIDYQLDSPKSYSELILPLIRRMQGILYGNNPNHPKSRFVCVKHAHNEPFRVTNEIIEYPGKFELSKILEKLMKTYIFSVCARYFQTYFCIKRKFVG